MNKYLTCSIFLFVLILSLGCNENIQSNPTVTSINIDNSCKEPLCLSDSISLLELENRALNENVLKIFSAAADPVRNKVYVSGILTPGIAVLDGKTELWSDTIDSGMGEDYSLKYLYIDSLKNYLYIIDGSNKFLRRIDLNNGEIIGPVPISSKSGIAAVDTKRGRIYLSSRLSPHFSIYDGKTLNLLYKTDEMGEGTGDLFYDDKNDVLYVLDFLNPIIYVFDPSTFKIKYKLDFEASCCGGNSKELQFDQETGTFYILVARHVDIISSTGKIIKTIDISEDRDIEKITFEPKSRKLLILSLDRAGDGVVSGVGGHLEVYEAGTGKKTTELSFGKKPHRFTINSSNNRIYVPNGDASVLWSISMDTYGTAKPIRLGDSVEGVLLSKNGDKIFMNSRLGGSYLIEYDIKGGTYETFTSGTWPIPIRLDSKGETLFVLNAWDSTLSVYSLYPKRSLISNISLGVPDGTTDRLPDMTVGSGNNIVYIGYPEFGKIIAVDWRNNSIIKTIIINGFQRGEQSGGPGDLQLAFDSKNQKLIVLWTQDAKLLIFDANRNYNLTREVDISSINLKKVKEGANVDLLFIDSDKNRLFVGPYEFNLATYQMTGRSIQEGQRIFAYDPIENAYWASGVKQDGKIQNDSVSVIDSETLKAKHVEILGQSHTTKPSFALDQNNRKLYVGHMTKAVLEIYNIYEIK